MSDFRAVPKGALDLAARLDDAPLTARTAYIVAVALADDWGRFEGSPRALAGRLGCEREEAESMLADLCALRLVRVYRATDAFGQTQVVAVVVGYDRLHGHLQKVIDPAKRRPSAWPDEDGTQSATHAHTRTPAHAPITRPSRAHDAHVHAPITGAGARPSRAHHAREEREQNRPDESRALAPSGPAALALSGDRAWGESHAVPLEADRDSPTGHSPPQSTVDAPPAADTPTLPPRVPAQELRAMVSIAQPPDPEPPEHAPPLTQFDTLRLTLAEFRPDVPRFADTVIGAFDPPLSSLPPHRASDLAAALQGFEPGTNTSTVVKYIRSWLAGFDA